MSESTLTEHTSPSPSEPPHFETPTSKSVLYNALLECVFDDEAISEERITLLATQNNPRRNPDNSFSWFDNSNKPFTFTFPALMDVSGKFAKLDPYFSNSGGTSVSLIIK